VVDERDALRTDFGRWIAEAATPHGQPLGWCVRPSDLDATAARLELRIEEGSRTTPTGERIAWRSAGIRDALSQPGLPFFIEWEDESLFPGTTPAPAATVASLEVACDPDQLRARLGDHALPVVVREGTDGLTAIVLDAPRGTVRLEPR
jgi:hypothetical protein